MEVATWILAVFIVILAASTAGLVWVTWKLAEHTLVLAKLRERLVVIETKRDEENADEKRREDLEAAFASAKIVQKIDTTILFEQSKRPADLTIEEMDAIECLQKLEKYTDDETMRGSIKQLCDVFDRARKENKLFTQLSPYPYLKTLQDRIPVFIEKIRHKRSGRTDT